MLESPIDQAAGPPETRERKLSARHVTALDGVRGLAVLAVILYHMAFMLTGDSLPVRILRAPFRIGWSGVDLFFVLSGFLITGILLDTRSSPNYFRAFYARRSLRIFPLYYLVLASIFIITHFTHSLDYVLPIRHDRIFYFFYLNNWWPLLRDTWHGNIIGHFWSLAVEEQFYLFWSLCVFLVSPRWIRSVTVAGILGALFLRSMLVAHSGITRNVVENTFCRMDALLVGAFLASAVRDAAFLRRIKKPAFIVAAVAATAALVVFYAIRREEIMDTLGFSLLALAYGGLILKAFLSGQDPESTVGKLLSTRQLTTVGKYSYGMYVYHVPLLHALRGFLRHHYPFEQHKSLILLFMVAMTAITFLVAKFSFDLFESRFLELKKYFRA